MEMGFIAGSIRHGLVDADVGTGVGKCGILLVEPPLGRESVQPVVMAKELDQVVFVVGALSNELRRSWFLVVRQHQTDLLPVLEEVLLKQGNDGTQVWED